jgi:DNA-binding NarL/FixJ family response regulator
MQMSHRILIIDDDPLHLDIYTMIVQKAGYVAIPRLVRFSGLDPVPDEKIDLVLLDYRLNSVKTAPEIAQDLRSKFPEAAIVLLSDFWSAPPDIAPFISQFVRKGEPAKLVEAIRSHLSEN